MSRREDWVRLRHMLDGVRQALEFVRDRNRGDLDSDSMLLLALTRAVEIVGEAAHHVSAEGQHRYPELPWAEMVGMRNRIIHAYFEVDFDVLWETVADDFPGLCSELEAVLVAEEQL
jgi:uncharacterized protein with HEPN domain